jgi:hypothetical protein
VKIPQKKSVKRFTWMPPIIKFQIIVRNKRITNSILHSWPVEIIQTHKNKHHKHHATGTSKYHHNEL